MACLDVNGVQRYLATGEGEDRERVEQHLDVCDDCRQLVAAAAQVASGEEGPSTISRYVLGERLGAGAMGVVHAAYDPELRRRVAIKLLLRRADARLLREAQALARVSHPNVISIFDVGTHAGGVFLAMELVDGHSLGGWLAAAPRRIDEIVAVLAAAGRGLAAAHAAGLVHRDFKPDNVLVGRDGRVRVTDFGLARDQADGTDTAAAESSDLLAADLTQAGTIVGTPAYMAPEQLAGAM
jgi:eukaryotic-like serine/threonine-protein kinase